jgi:hypothetical protein
MGAAVVLVMMAACGDTPFVQQCMTSGGTSQLVSQAALLRVDVYPGDVTCDGNVAPSGSTAALSSRSFLQGQPISLDVPPGRHTIALTAYADTAGTSPIGAGCAADTEFKPGSQICIDLTVGEVDASVANACGPECGFFQFCGAGVCEPGCKTSSECALLASMGGPDAGADGGSGSAKVCNVESHTCVECVTSSDCNTGKPAACCNGACIPEGTCCSAMDCTMPPAPSTCYAAMGTCTAIGSMCKYTQNAGSKICGATCCVALNGTCNSNCTTACNAGFADCNGDPSDGCETNLAATGKKLCGAACVPATSCCTAADCTTPPAPTSCYPAQGTCPVAGGTCNFAVSSGAKVCAGNLCCNPNNATCDASCVAMCASGFKDCNNSPTDGCETTCDPVNPSDGCYLNGATTTCCAANMHNCDGNQANGCECGTSCCSNPNNGGAPDCLVKNHSDGWNHMFSACYPLGVPGTASTPGTGYSATVATDAANADVMQAGTVVTGRGCYTGQQQVISACKENKDPNTNKTIDCTCWAYGSTAGSCKDPQDGISKPCSSFIGHTYFATGPCGCISVTDGTYQ